MDLVVNHTSTEHAWFQQVAKDKASATRDWYIWAEDQGGLLQEPAPQALTRHGMRSTGPITWARSGAGCRT